jgi:XTP/dITP diphosphohydrolase
MARRLGRGSRLVLASHNPGKLREIAALLAPFGLDVVSVGALGLPEPNEDAPDFVGNARIKALAAARGAGLVALADDSGFCLAALDGAPGVHSARWAGPGKDFAAAMARANDGLGASGLGASGLGANSLGADRRAWFVAALSLAWPDGETASFLGRVDGTAVWPPRGTLGFGYDPMFCPTGSAATFGEMAPGAKEAISHRTRAFAQLRAACFG